jgi:hypothetical protein
VDYTWAPYPRDAKRSAQLLYYPSTTPALLVNQTATGAVDLSPYMTRAKQTNADLQVSVTWHTELYGSAQPKPGQFLEVKLDGKQLWWGVIESLSDYRLSNGERSLSIVARSRDATPYWREVRRITSIYPVATPFALIARDIALAMDLEDTEINLPGASGFTVHSNTQMADLPAWDMLTQLYEPFGLQPMVDAHGRLKTISRDVTRPVDANLDIDRVLAVSGSKSRPSLTGVHVKWLDAKLTRVEQQDQELATATVTAGFFQSKQKQDVKFSTDGSQRASNTYLQIKQSANSGVMAVCHEKYQQLTPTTGRITLTTKTWVPTLVVGLMGAMLAASKLPDIAPTTGGPTFPTGKIVHGAAELAVLLVMASIGTGMYAVKGTPFDYVHTRNTMEAYDSTAPQWQQRIEEIENDFIGTEDAAQGYAVRELIYRNRAGFSFGADVVDDPRLEPGDIVQFPDGTKLYITSYSRDLTRGAPAVLSLEGFQV